MHLLVIAQGLADFVRTAWLTQEVLIENGKNWMNERGQEIFARELTIDRKHNSLGCNEDED